MTSLPQPTDAEMRELADWIKERPQIVPVMDLLPPACYVVAAEGQRLICPAPGVVGILVQYNEDDDGHISCVVQDGVFSGECDPAWLVAVDSDEQFRLYREAKRLAGVAS